MSGQEAMLFWARIEEPAIGEPGGIFMYMRPRGELKEPGVFSYPSKGPRLFQFPYSRTLHEAVQKLIDAIVTDSGSPIVIAFFAPNEKDRLKGRAAGHPAEGERKGKATDGTGSMSLGPGENIYQLPPAKMPEKPD